MWNRVAVECHWLERDETSAGICALNLGSSANYYPSETNIRYLLQDSKHLQSHACRKDCLLVSICGKRQLSASIVLLLQDCQDECTSSWASRDLLCQLSTID